MLLRRVTKHVTDQNWFAVVIDFLIVVVGVFIGIQVANWNSEQEERALEAVYTERLHKEVIDLESIRKATIVTRRDILEYLKGASKKLMSPIGDPLTEGQCFFLAINPSSTNPTDDLPLVMELLSSGRLTIFNNEELESALGKFLITRTRARDSRTGIMDKLPRLDQDFSELFFIQGSILEGVINSQKYIHTDKQKAWDILFSKVSIKCDEIAMRTNQLFLNQLSIFEFQYYFHVRDNENVSSSLAKLHEELDRTLNIKHSGMQ